MYSLKSFASFSISAVPLAFISFIIASTFCTGVTPMLAESWYDKVGATRANKRAIIFCRRLALASLDHKPLSAIMVTFSTLWK